jgi:predicted DNA-binding transcriptional regulator YafY
MPDFFLPPVNLSFEEAFNLVIATRTFSKDKDESQQRTIDSAISKIIARLPEETQHRLESTLNKQKSGADGMKIIQKHDFNRGFTRQSDDSQTYTRAAAMD